MRTVFRTLLIVLGAIALSACSGGDKVKRNSPTQVGEEVTKYTEKRDPGKLRKLACDPENVPPRNDRVKLEFDDLIFGDTRTSEITSELAITGILKVERDGDTVFEGDFEWQLKVEKVGDNDWCFRVTESAMPVPD